MKSRLKVASFCIVTALIGIGLGAMDQIQHNRQTNASLNLLCAVQPHLDQCRAREATAKSIRYSFNGQEFRDGTAVSSFGANE